MSDQSHSLLDARSFAPQERNSDWRGWTWAAWLTLGLAFLIRQVLVWKGGQDYWPDEMRYGVSTNVADHLLHGRVQEAIRLGVSTVDHVGFKLWGVPVALCQGMPGYSLAWAAAYFSFWGWLGLVFWWRLALQWGATRREGFVGVVLLSGSLSLHYYTRHLLPYDLAMMGCAVGFWWGSRGDRWFHAFGAGLAVGVSFLCYNGYWVLGGVALTALCLGKRMRSGVRQMLLDGVGAGLGLILPLLAFVLAGRAYGFDLVAKFREFSGSINQGDFGGGARLVGEYLWTTGAVAPLVFLLLPALAWRKLSLESRRRIVFWLCAGLSVLGVLVVFSDLLPRFVVYGRLVRAAVPFLLLAVAASLEAVWDLGRGWRLAGAAIALAAVTSSSGPWRAVWEQRFPYVYRQDAWQLLASAPRGRAALQVRAQNFDWRLWPAEGVAVVAGPREPIANALHPQGFRPYQFEGLLADERRALANRTNEMEVFVDRSVEVTGDGKGGFPGALRLRVYVAPGRDFYRQPLLTSGATGRGNLLGLQIIGQSARFVLDCWGDGLAESPSIQWNTDQAHEVEILAGILFPPECPPGMSAESFQWLQNHLVVRVDQQSLWVAKVRFNRPDPDTLLLGANLLGGSTLAPNLFGRIDRVDTESAPALTPEDYSGLPILRWRPRWGGSDFVLPRDPIAADSNLVLPFEGWPGPFRFRLRRPEQFDAVPRPLLTTGVTGAGDVLFLRWLAEGRAQVGWDHWGAGATLSEPFSWSPGSEQEVVVNLPSLCPAPTDTQWMLRENLRPLGQWGAVTVGQKIVFVRKAEAHFTRQETITPLKNLIGASSASPDFPGGPEEYHALSTAELLDLSKLISSSAP